jgi:hypothetical protein
MMVTKKELMKRVSHMKDPKKKYVIPAVFKRESRKVSGEIWLSL